MEDVYWSLRCINGGDLEYQWIKGYLAFGHDDLHTWKNRFRFGTKNEARYYLSQYRKTNKDFSNLMSLKFVYVKVKRTISIETEFKRKESLGDLIRRKLK